MRHHSEEWAAQSRPTCFDVARFSIGQGSAPVQPILDQAAGDRIEARQAECVIVRMR
jgi:hypothetical protein